MKKKTAKNASNTPTASEHAGTGLAPGISKIELNIVDGKIAYLKTVAPTSGFRDSFTDGPIWRDTFADGGQWVSNFNNLLQKGTGLRHPATQLALEKIQQVLNEKTSGRKTKA